MAGVPNKEAEPAYAEEQTHAAGRGRFGACATGMLEPIGQVHIDRHFLGQYGENEANVIVQRGGNTWRTCATARLPDHRHMLLAVPLIIFLFYRLPPARAAGFGQPHPPLHRLGTRVHWVTADPFLALAFTG